MMTNDERRAKEVEDRVRKTSDQGSYIISEADLEWLLASRLAWKYTAKCYAAAALNDDQWRRGAR